MRTDRLINRAHAAGERNQETSLLVRNWCRHVRIDRVGGAGMVEELTGLPIGHLHLSCDHAAAGGMATWDLADAAIDFHDRNCTNCQKHERVGIPNLSKLVAERDARAKQVGEQQRLVQERLAAALTKRDAVRADIRSRQPVESMSLLEIIGEFDRTHDKSLSQQFSGAAKVAPESFTQEIVDYCFGLLEGDEHWFVEMGLSALRHLSVDKARLVNCAIRSIASDGAASIAFELVRDHADLVDPSRIHSAFPKLVWRAEPEDSLLHSGTTRTTDASPLVAAYRARSVDVEKAIFAALDSRDPYLVSAGARAIGILTKLSNLRPRLFARSLATKLARSHLLMDARPQLSSGDDEAIGWLRRALILALDDDPEEVDKIVGNYLDSAPPEGEARIYRTYADIIDSSIKEDDGSARPHPAWHIALRRVIRAATSSSEHEILVIFRDAISYLSRDIVSHARTEMTTILGAAFRLDDRFQERSQIEINPNDWLATSEHSGVQDLIRQLQSNFVTWASRCAAEDSAAAAEYLDVLRNIPDGRDEMRAALINELAPLAHTPNRLNALLPDLYSAMMHSSALVRGAATNALSKLDHARMADLPDLVFDAYLVHLADPYRYVHVTAVEALDSLDLPKKRKPEAAMRVWALIDSYGRSKDRDRFLVKCILSFLRQFADLRLNRETLGKRFVTHLARVKPEFYADDLWWLYQHLGSVEGFSTLVVKALADPDTMQYREKEVLEALRVLPTDAIEKHAAELVSIAGLGANFGDVTWSIVEVFTRARQWHSAVQVCQHAFDTVPNTVEWQARKRHLELHLIAAQFEASIADGKLGDLPALMTGWSDAESKIKRIEERR